jgi:cobyrinic acid a,c-diamide synthase
LSVRIGGATLVQGNDHNRGGAVLEVRELFDSITMDTDIDGDRWSKAITALSNCQEAVTACAGAMVMLGSDMASSVLRDMDCADVVQATTRVLTRATDLDHSMLNAQLEACVIACERSNEMCRAHAEHHSHCRICSEATKECADACRELLSTVHQ